MEHKLRVLHVDDDADARTLMGFVLRGDPELEEVGALADAAALTAEVARTSPDVLLVDLTMPGRSPLDAIEEVHAAYPKLRIVVVSGRSEPELHERAHAAGAWGWVTKSDGVDETLSAIRGSSNASLEHRLRKRLPELRSTVPRLFLLDWPLRPIEKKQTRYRTSQRARLSSR